MEFWHKRVTPAADQPAVPALCSWMTAQRRDVATRQPPAYEQKVASRGRRSAPKLVDRAFLEQVALSYLERFDATEVKFRAMLLRRARKALQEQHTTSREEVAADGELAAVQAWIDEIVLRFKASRLISDERFAEMHARSLRERGLSARAIVARLRTKGVSAQVAAEVLERAREQSGASKSDDELAAARRLVRRRRLGPHRRRPADEGTRRRELAILARAGFSYETSARALVEDEGAL